MSNFDEEYFRLTIRMHHTAEHAEARVERANKLIRKLTESGVLADGVILGPIIHERQYGPRKGGPDSAQFVQAILHVPQGLGIVLWDFEEYLRLEDQQHELECAAMSKFVPFSECEVGIKSLFAPHIPGLMNKLRKRLA